MRARHARSQWRALWLALASLCIGPPAGAALPRAVAQAFDDAGVPLSHVAIVVQEVGARRPRLTHRAEQPMNPASVMKLVTTFAALDLLGPEYRWRTEAYLDGPLDAGVLRGNLVLKGGGDPRITIEQWQAFMAALRHAGLAAVDGSLVLDRSAFAPRAFDPGAFDGATHAAYNVGPDALLVNFKAVRLRFAPGAQGMASVEAEPALPGVRIAAAPPLSSEPCADWHRQLAPRIADDGAQARVEFAGSYPADCGEREWWLALLDAPHYAYDMFAAYFGATGGRFAGKLVDGHAPPGATPFAVLESPPLAEIVRDINKRSNNVMARQVYLSLALAAGAPPATPRKAAAAVRGVLARRQVDIPGLVLDNGAGLSRRARVTAGGLVRLLLAAERSPARDAFVDSLAIAAVDGTVEHRFRDIPAGEAHLKTGTLDGVRAIAGYVQGASGRRYALAAMVNDRHAAHAAGALEYLVRWIDTEGTAAAPCATSPARGGCP